MLAEPKFLIRINPELRRLRAGAEAASDPPMPVPDSTLVARVAGPVEPITERDAPPRAGTRPPPRQVRLRRDGLRPLCLDALPVLVLPLDAGRRPASCSGGPPEASLQTGSDGSQVRGQMAIYLDPEDRLVAHVREPRGKSTRPAFRAAWISDPLDLLALLGSARPAWRASLEPVLHAPDDARAPPHPRDRGPEPVTRA